jgi:SPP1 gp7 family putative phage head morphogenesis protein
VTIKLHHGIAKDNAFVQRMGELLAQHMAAADLLGRMQIVRHAQAKAGKKIPISQKTRRITFAEGDMKFTFNIPATDAKNYISNLTPVTKEIFDGLTAQYRKDAFTLAGASDTRLVQKVQTALADIVEKGETASDFRQAAKALTDAAGVQELNAFTLDTAYQIALQKAYSNGRLEQMQEPHMLEALPFWQYWTVGDLRVRPEHRLLDGFIARGVDPVWAKIYPPSGFGCRCSVVPLPEDEALKLDPQASEGGLERLPVLARMMVPQKDFHGLISG